ncbi:branched-chain amino acid ABC transporter permease [Candidatus Aerophobetes bacterium]|uniref:Branched-chain amino acid ABC transporter permease n=1 Tax=Aerophobetes bacterium TaxID=2030807 RepID=A0A662DCP7_UNCAE|nr:MAG: branched-chain amino acid ABC transporter permease [Candidatus Aerophobetes bacterium]
MWMQLTLNGIIAGSIYALVALGFVLIYRTVRFFHLAHGGVYTAGTYAAYSTYMVLLKAGSNSIVLNLFFATIVGMIVAGILGVFIDRIVYYPLRKSFASDLIHLLASFGVFVFIQNFIQLIYGAQILTMRTWPVKEGHHILSAVITNVQIVIIITSIAVMSVLWFFVKKTKFGKAIRAVSDDPVGASVVGINPEKTITIVFFIGSALAGLAGTLVSLETNIEPSMGFNAILKGIIAAIIGGIGSFPGAVLGGFLLGFAENFGIWKIQAGWKDTIAFVILILFLLFKPDGILGTKIKMEKD